MKIANSSIISVVHKNLPPFQLADDAVSRLKQKFLESFGARRLIRRRFTLDNSTVVSASRY